MGVKVDSFIFQVSSESDRGDQERALAGDGLLPVMAFANGPENAFLLAARQDDLKAAFAQARDLAEGLGAEQLALRMRVFEQLAYAVETDMKYQAQDSDFPNDVIFLLIQALYQYGLDGPDDIAPCAVRFVRENLAEPDFELAPTRDEPAPDHA
jgi:hypothetical protein